MEDTVDVSQAQWAPSVSAPCRLRGRDSGYGWVVQVEGFAWIFEGFFREPVLHPWQSKHVLTVQVQISVQLAVRKQPGKQALKCVRKWCVFFNRENNTEVMRLTASCWLGSLEVFLGVTNRWLGLGGVFLLEVQYSILKSLISTCVLSYVGSREDWLLDRICES